MGQLFGGESKKKCCCGDESVCCTGRPCPASGEPNALPSSLTIEVNATFNAPPIVTPSGTIFSPPANSNCYDFSFTLNGSCVEGIVTYAGIGEHTCTWCSRSYTIRLSILVVCGVGGGGWFLSVEALASPGDCNLDVSGDQYFSNLTKHSCDPVLLSGDLNRCLDCLFTCQIGAIMIAPGVLVPVIATHSPFCLSFTISEDP